MSEIVAALHRLPPGPAGILIRHAERHPITDFSNGYAVPLTERGHQQALELGRTLAAWSPLDLWHSPAPRCADTALRIAQGVVEAGGQANFSGPDEDLLGPYLLQVPEALALAQLMGEGFLRNWFDGRIDAHVIQPHGLAARVQLNTIRRKVVSAPASGLVVAVSHDWNIMAVRDCLLGVRHEDVGWLNYLDGISVVDNGSTAWIASSGRLVRLSE